jgi:AcrR family transcriptional regulator
LAYRRTEKVEARLADARAAIVRAARRVVAHGGFTAAPIAAVAAAAGVATGTVYRHFPSKAELMAEMLRATGGREVAVVRAVAAADSPPAARLADSLRVFAERALRGARLAYANIFEPASPEVEDARLAIRRDLAAVLAGVIRDGIAAGAFARMDARLAAASVVGAMLEALVGPLAPERRGRDDRAVIRDIVAFCMRALGAEEAGPARRRQAARGRGGGARAFSGRRGGAAPPGAPSFAARARARGGNWRSPRCACPSPRRPGRG